MFLLYDERSGSTLFSSYLNQYRGICVSQESEFVSRIFEFPGSISLENFDKINAFLCLEPQFLDFDLNLDIVRERISKINGSVSKKRFIEIIVDEYFKNRDPKAEYLIIKHAPYIYLSKIRELFPEVTFLHIVRDVRGVFNSKKRNYSLDGSIMDNNPLHASWTWVQKLKKVTEHEDIIFTVRYEDLVKNTNGVMDKVLDWMNVQEESRKKIKSRINYYETIGTQQKRLHKNLTREPNPGYTDKWQNQLTVSELSLLNYWCEKYLTKYGYVLKASNTWIVFVYTFMYLIKYLIKKSINILSLLKEPSVLKLKFKRKYKMLKS